MQPGALRPYEDALESGEQLHLHNPGGRATLLDVGRWLGPADAIDRSAVGSSVGPVLDVGCGPGRLVHLLHEDGIDVLGIDIAAVAVALARRRGAAAQLCDVFGPVPGEGGWTTVLLLDGNIGIGGDPVRLLHRVDELLAPGGRVLVETDRDDHADAQGWMRFSRHDLPTGVPFSWARIGLRSLTARIPDTDLQVGQVRRLGGRTFAMLERPGEARPR